MILDGLELAGFIKQRHYDQVRALRAAPKLLIISAGDDAATKKYIRAKERYGFDIGAVVEHWGMHAAAPEQNRQLVEGLVKQEDTHGVIIQLPLPEAIDEEEYINLIPVSKDVDGLRPDSNFDPATPKGIMWLLGSYDIKPRGKTAVVVGQGRLVGEPISRMLEDSGAEVIVCDEDTEDLAAETLQGDIIVMATGQKHLLKPGMVKPGAAIVDAGSPWPEVDPELLETPGLKITPNPGGVGPMTVAALFDNLLLAAQRAK